MAEYLNMSLDDVIKVSRKGSNNKSEFRKFSTNRLNKKPIRKFNNQQASSFKNNPKSTNRNIIHQVEKKEKLNFRRLRIENLDRNIDNSELRGSAIVEYDNEEAAKKAIESYDIPLDDVIKMDKEGHTMEVEEGSSSNKEFTKVFVGNLSYQTSWQDLKDYMKTVGEVLYADVFMDNYGKSKGCGVVEFASNELARKAIATLNETDLNGRKIFIKESNENRPKKDFRKEGKGYPKERSRSRSDDEDYDRKPAPHYKKPKYHEEKNYYYDANRKPLSKGFQEGFKLYVQNLPYSTTWQDLKDGFKTFGEVVRADIKQDFSGKSQGAGFVIFREQEDADNAIKNMDKTMFGGREISVRFWN